MSKTTNLDQPWLWAHESAEKMTHLKELGPLANLSFSRSSKETMTMSHGPCVVHRPRLETGTPILGGALHRPGRWPARSRTPPGHCWARPTILTGYFSSLSFLNIRSSHARAPALFQFALSEYTKRSRSSSRSSFLFLNTRSSSASCYKVSACSRKHSQLFSFRLKLSILSVYFG
jgi:hypothetical protein